MARSARSVGFRRRPLVRSGRTEAETVPAYLYAVLGAAVAATLAWCLLLAWGAVHLVEDLLL